MDKKGHRQRLKKQFLENPESFDDARILELLLTYSIPQKDIKKTAEGLIKHFGSISEVIVSDFEKLTKFNDIKDNSATLLKLVEWIRKKYPINKKETKETVKDKPQISLFDEKSEIKKLETKKTIVLKTQDKIKVFLPTQYWMRLLEFYHLLMKTKVMKKIG